ncbi:MAG: hypothetical protein JNJ69_10435 [Leptospiraceae bacterium]|nr:hypothetical protein [Leptospiraceae bacterium]
MKQIGRLLTLVILTASTACKNKIGTSESIKADLKNYVTVELPKHGELFRLIGALSETYKDAGGGDSHSDDKKEDSEIETLGAAISELKNTKILTDDVRKVHADLQEAVVKLQDSLKKIEALKQAKDFSAIRGVFPAIQDIIKGIRLVDDWNEALAHGCKANGLGAEYNTFRKKYGLKSH